MTALILRGLAVGAGYAIVGGVICVGIAAWAARRLERADVGLP